MRFKPDDKRYRVDEDKAIKALLDEKSRLEQTAEARRAEVDAMAGVVNLERQRVASIEALVALGDQPQSAADKADIEAQKAEDALQKAKRRLAAIKEAQVILGKRIDSERAVVQARVDKAILDDFSKAAQEAVDLTEKAAQAHADLAAFDDLARRLSSLPVFRQRNYLPGHTGGMTKGGYKLSLSTTEDWICKMRGRGLAKSSRLEKEFGGIVTKTIERYGGGK